MLPQKNVYYLNSEIKLQFENMLIRITRFTRIDDDSAWDIPAHAHKNYELHYIYEGQGKITLGNNAFTVAAGQFYICPPYIDHSQATLTGHVMKEYCIECDIACPKDECSEEANTLLQTVARSLYYCYNEQHGFLKYNFDLLDRLFRDTSAQALSGTDFMTKSTLLSTVMGMLTFVQIENGSQDDQTLDRNDINYKRASAILNYLEANYKKDVTLAECARIFALSEKQINRILKKVFDNTFHALKVQTRANVAVRLIQTTEYPLEFIAGEAGFSGYRQMIRSFKTLGLDSPTSYRRK